MVKKMIDSAGAGHYDSYKSGIKYLFEGRYAPVNTSSVHWPELKTELLARGVNVIDYDAISSGAVHNIKDVSFAHFDWVYGNTGSFAAIDEITSFPNVWKQITFQAGSVASCYRSFGAALGTYPYGGLYSYSGGALTSWSKTDASDVSIRQQNDVVIDEAGNNLWCALGVNPSWVSWGGGTSDVPNADAEDRRGGGIAVYDKAGNFLRRHTKASTGGGLISDAVYQVRYDKWNNRIWVGTFRGLCYYDLGSGSWGRITGLSDLGAPAMIHDLYVDPTTSGRYIYATFRTANGSLAPTFSANWRWLWEYDTSTSMVKNYNLGLGSQESTSIVKTEATSVWAVCHSSWARVVKYRLDTLTKIQDICLTNIDGTNYNGN
ncbi:MAG: hypothetical protein JNM63_12350, partial [Spirochaetia bacterium]|nr:hypothetical protein [Spirochaetia bacterium]